MYPHLGGRVPAATPRDDGTEPNLAKAFPAALATMWPIVWEAGSPDILSLTHPRPPIINPSVPGGCRSWHTLGLVQRRRPVFAVLHPATWAFSSPSLPCWDTIPDLLSQSPSQTELGHGSFLLSPDGSTLYSGSQARLGGPPGHFLPSWNSSTTESHFLSFLNFTRSWPYLSPSIFQNLPHLDSPALQPPTNNLMGSSQAQAPKHSFLYIFFFHPGHLSTALGQPEAAAWPAPASLTPSVLTCSHPHLLTAP